MTTNKSKSLISVLSEFDNQSLTSGIAIRVLRKSLNFTLKDVQSLTGIRETHLSAIENDFYELTKKNAEKIAAMAELSTKEEGSVLNDALGKILGLDIYEDRGTL